MNPPAVLRRNVLAVSLNSANIEGMVLAAMLLSRQYLRKISVVPENLASTWEKHVCRALEPRQYVGEALWSSP